MLLLLIYRCVVVSMVVIVEIIVDCCHVHVVCIVDDFFLLNNRRTLLANSTSLLPTTKACLDVILSEPFCRLLSHLTGLDLVHNVIRSDNTVESPSSTSESGVEELNQSNEKTKAVCYLTKDESCSSRTSVSDGKNDENMLKDSGGCKNRSISKKCRDSEFSENRVNTQKTLSEPLRKASELKDSLINAHPSFASSVLQDESTSKQSPPAGLCRGDLCCWQPGSYTLAGGEADPGLGKFCLDAILYFCCEGIATCVYVYCDIWCILIFFAD